MKGDCFANSTTAARCLLSAMQAAKGQIRASQAPLHPSQTGLAPDESGEAFVRVAREIS